MTTRSQTLAMARALASDADVVERLREKMPDGMEQLDRIMSGNVQRNDAVVLKALALALQYSQPLPKQTLAVEGTVGIQVVDPYAECVSVDAEVLPVVEPVKALGPIVRRAAKPEGESA